MPEDDPIVGLLGDPLQLLAEGIVDPLVDQEQAGRDRLGETVSDRGAGVLGVRGDRHEDPSSRGHR